MKTETRTRLAATRRTAALRARRAIDVATAVVGAFEEDAETEDDVNLGTRLHPRTRGDR